MARIHESDLNRVKDEFFHRGESIADWAEQHGFSSNAVYQVLSGRCQATRGESHRIAVALGLKTELPRHMAHGFSPANQEATM
jgi:gp16 family phage-associated protein